jgi:hypothetical protein
MTERLVTQIDIATPAPQLLFNDSAMSAIPDAVKTSGGILYFLILDNSANNVPVFLQIWDLAVGSVVVGSTGAYEVVSCPSGVFRAVPQTTQGKGGFTVTLPTFDYIPIPGSSVVTVSYRTSAAPGKVFSNAITAVVTTSLVGAISSASPVSVTICYQ